MGGFEIPTSQIYPVAKRQAGYYIYCLYIFPPAVHQWCRKTSYFTQRQQSRHLHPTMVINDMVRPEGGATTVPVESAWTATNGYIREPELKPIQYTAAYKDKDKVAYELSKLPFDSPRRLKVIVSGAGCSGLDFAHAVESGRLGNIDLRIYEKNAGLGGTWWENRYPGCACDIPSHNYLVCSSIFTPPSFTQGNNSHKPPPTPC